MRHRQRILALIVMIGLCSTTSIAGASIIYSFVTTSTNPAGLFDVRGELIVQQSTAASGFTVDFSNTGNFGEFPPPSGMTTMPIPLDGLLALRLDLTYADPLIPPLRLRQSDFETTALSFLSGFRAELQLTGAPSGALDGRIFFNTSSAGVSFERDIELLLAGSTFTGRQANEGGGLAACFPSDGCTFAGVIRVSVPEPSTLSLLGFGLATIVVAARRRRAAEA